MGVSVWGGTAQGTLRCQAVRASEHARLPSQGGQTLQPVLALQFSSGSMRAAAQRWSGLVHCCIWAS